MVFISEDITMLHTRIQKVRPYENGGSIKVNNRHNINMCSADILHISISVYSEKKIIMIFFFILLSELLKQLIMNQK